MNNLEILKQELVNQKNVIEKKGGNVIVANTNPSPAEITAALQSFAPKDLSDANAIEADVLEGKTFYAGNGELKTGTLKDKADFYKHCFEYQANVATSQQEFVYDIPEDITIIHYGIFRYNSNNISINFHPNIQTIQQYAFESTPNFKFYNFQEMSNLKTIDAYAFCNSAVGYLDLLEIPDSVEELGIRAFQNMLAENGSVNIPTYISSIGSSCFISDTIVHAKNFNISVNTPLLSLSSNCLEGCVFDCDLIVPNSVQSIGAKFLYDGSFNNITISNNVTSIAANCFNATSTTALSDVRYKTITFVRQTPPSISSSAFSTQAMQNGLKIYVPDESYDAYVAKMANFKSCVYPVSQKN